MSRGGISEDAASAHSAISAYSASAFRSGDHLSRWQLANTPERQPLIRKPWHRTPLIDHTYRFRKRKRRQAKIDRPKHPGSDVLVPVSRIEGRRQQIGRPG